MYIDYLEYMSGYRGADEATRYSPQQQKTVERIVADHLERYAKLSWHIHFSRAAMPARHRAFAYMEILLPTQHDYDL